jgi:hypothetical protein
MKTKLTIILLFALFIGYSDLSFGGNGPVDPADKGSGILGFGIGPGIPYYGGHGFGPAILVHYDHSIWRVGPGSISLGGQVGVSFFWHDITIQNNHYKRRWTNLGFAFRGAYHYGWKVAGLDTYAGFGAGPRFSMYNNGGYYETTKSSQVGFLPTIFFGGSYFFNPLIGLNAEFGYNFAYAAIGLNFRLTK